MLLALAVTTAEMVTLGIFMAGHHLVITTACPCPCHHEPSPSIPRPHQRFSGFGNQSRRATGASSSLSAHARANAHAKANHPHKQHTRSTSAHYYTEQRTVLRELRSMYSMYYVRVHRTCVALLCNSLVHNRPVQPASKAQPPSSNKLRESSYLVQVHRTM